MEDIAIFLICISIIELILPSGSFNSYIRLFLGVVFIVVLLVPLKDNNIKSSVTDMQSFDTNSNIEINKSEDIKNVTYEDMLKAQIQNNILQMASNKNVEVSGVDIVFESVTRDSFVIKDINITVKNAKENDLIHLKNLIFEVYSSSLRNINFVYDSN